MNRKFILMASMICLPLIIAGCSAVTQQDTSSPDVGDKAQSVAVETSAEEVTIAGESSIVPVSEADSAAVDESVSDEVVVLQDQPESDETAANKTQNAPTSEIPQFEHELAEGGYHWSQLLARDSIIPIYNPEFAPAAEAPYDDNELVIGLEINGEAKAYAIGPLNGREMVNDTVGGIPVLVTW